MSSDTTYSQWVTQQLYSYNFEIVQFTACVSLDETIQTADT